MAVTSRLDPATHRPPAARCPRPSPRSGDTPRPAAGPAPPARARAAAGRPRHHPVPGHRAAVPGHDRADLPGRGPPGRSAGTSAIAPYDITRPGGIRSTSVEHRLDVLVRSSRAATIWEPPPGGPRDRDRAEWAACAKQVTDGPAGRRQGRLVLADHRRRRARPRPGRRARRRARPAGRRRPRGGAGLLRRDRRRAGPARAAPPPARPGHPAGRRQRRAGAADAARYTDAFARHGRTVGQVLLTVDDVTRRAHYRNAYRTLRRLLDLRRGADRQRERHGRHRGDPVRRQRPAGRAGRRAGPRRPAGPALRRGRALHRRPAPTRRRAGSPRCAATTDLAGVAIGGAGRAGVGTGGMVTKVEAARIATGSGIPVVLTAAAAGRARRWPASRSARSSTGRGERPAARLFWLAHATSPRGRLHLDAGRGRGRRRPARVAAAGRHHRRGRRVRRRRPGRPGRRRRRAGRPRPGQLRRRASCPACSAAPPPSSPRRSARRTNARSSTATTWCCCEPGAPRSAGMASCSA